MASQTCLRCLQRLAISPTNASKATFSTSARLLGLSKKNPAQAAVNRRLRADQRKTKKSEKVKKTPAIGERRAARKRIVLSNTNAFEIYDMQDWSDTNYADKNLLGTMVKLQDPLVDFLRDTEAFEVSQGWRFFKRPSTLIRKETMDIATHVQQSSEQNNRPEPMRRLVLGERGSGKSILLLQAQAIAFQAGWVVIHFPGGQHLSKAVTSYEPVPNTNPIKYIQPEYTALLLARIAKANRKVLSKYRLSQEHDLPLPVPPKTSLAQLAEMGAEDPTVAWPIYKALWAELTSTSAEQRRPPVLLTLNSIAHISRLSDYLAPDMHYIHSHNLTLVEHFISYLTGDLPLPNGGAVLAADDISNRISAPSLDLAIQQRESDGPNATKLPLRDPLHPYNVHDPVVVERMRRVDIMRVPRLSRNEARTILEYMANSGMMQATVTDELVAQKMTLAGGGVIGQLEKGVLKAL